MSLESLVDAVRQYLASQYMPVVNDWISGFVEYLTEDSSNNHTEADIKNLAKEQWLLNDLKDISPGSLPPNLKDKNKTILNGRFVLQINAALDIGTPGYQQYLKLQKVNMENIDATTKYDDKIPNHRMIKLYLTDGVQSITGIEYKPMRNLSLDIIPGCKVLLKGPIECRRGVLLLYEASIEMLGGEVEEMAVSNSLAGLLSSKLGVPITQEPDPSTASHPRNTNIPTPHAQMPPSRSDEETARPVARVTGIPVAQSIPDDDIDMDHIAAIEAEYYNPGKRSLTDVDSKPEKKLKTETQPQHTNTTNFNNADDYPDDLDCFEEEDDEYLKEIEAKIDAHENKNSVVKGPVVVSSEPFVYIMQINNMKDSDKAGRIFKVKAQIMKLLSKLSVGKDGWSLRCTLIDGTGNIDVDFTSDVLSKLVGFSPQEMNDIKRGCKKYRVFSNTF